jgi:small conductance mechanosensitive channel
VLSIPGLIQTVPQFEIPDFDTAELADAIMLREMLGTAMKIAVILLLAWLSYFVLRLVLRRIRIAYATSDKGTISIQEQRVATMVGLVRSAGLVFIGVITLFMILTAIGVNIAPLLAGAGVAGLAISFGAQSLVKDIITGLFILFENQFGVGDVVRVGTVSGSVESMTLRVVVLRDIEGVVHTIPNGEITQVSNLTRSFSRTVLKIGVAYKEDVDRVLLVLRQVVKELWEDPDWKPMLLQEIEVPGIEELGDSAVSFRVLATTVPLRQWEVARELRRRIKIRFDAEGIEIPFPHRTVYIASPPGEPAAPERIADNG